MLLWFFFFNWSLLTPFQGASLKGPYTGYWKTRNPEKKQEREWEQEKERKKNLKNEIKNQITGSSQDSS